MKGFLAAPVNAFESAYIVRQVALRALSSIATSHALLERSSFVLPPDSQKLILVITVSLILPIGPPKRPRYTGEDSKKATTELDVITSTNADPGTGPSVQVFCSIRSF